MSDEVRRLPPHISEADVILITELVTPVIARKAYDAGVVEGIRRAREAAEKMKPSGDGSYEDDWERGFRSGHDETLRAINRLLATP